MRKKLQSTISTINKKKALDKIYKIVVPLIFIGLFFLIWQIMVWSGRFSQLELPSPERTYKAFIYAKDRIMANTSITLYASALGLFFGVLLGFVIALLMDWFKIFRVGFRPLLTISQTIPTIVIAPLFVIWFGIGITPRVLLVVLTTFFPIAIGLADGYASCDPDMIDLMRAMGAGRVKIFWHAKVPNALPNFFSSLRISATYAIVAAVVSEWSGGGNDGLGRYIQIAKGMARTDIMFASIIWIVLLSLLLMLGIELIKKLFVRWDKKEN